MTKRIPSAVLFIGLLWLLVPLCANAEPVRVRFDELPDLNAALRALDGGEKAVQTSDQGTRIIRVPLDLKPAVRIAVAKNIAAVRLALDAFEQERKRILQTVSPGAVEKIKDDAKLLERFGVLWTKAVEEPVTVDLQLLTEDQLNLEANREITGSILAALRPILKK